MEKRLIITKAGSDDARQIQKLTLPYLIDYAKKCNADLHIDYQLDHEDKWVGYHKFFSYPKHFNKYDRLLHVDADMFIKPSCPDLFTITPSHAFSAVDESKVVLPFDGDRLSHMRQVMNEWGYNDPDYGIYFNNGLFMIPKCYEHMLTLPTYPETYINKMFYEQTHMNIRLIYYRIPFHELDYRFNFMWVHEQSGYKKDDAYIVHYAGRLGGLPIDQLCDRIKDDIKRYG